MIEIIDFLMNQSSIPKDFATWMIRHGEVYHFVAHSEHKNHPLLDIDDSHNNSLMLYQMFDLDYMEGFYITREMPNAIQDHAWNIDKNGNPIDVTTEAFGIGVVERFGIKIPRGCMEEWLYKYQGGQGILKFYYSCCIGEYKTSDDISSWIEHGDNL